MSLNQLKNPADPTPECTKHRAIKARDPAKPTLVSARYRLAKAIRTAQLRQLPCVYFLRGDKRCLKLQQRKCGGTRALHSAVYLAAIQQAQFMEM